MKIYTKNLRYICLFAIAIWTFSCSDDDSGKTVTVYPKKELIKDMIGVNRLDSFYIENKSTRESCLSGACPVGIKGDYPKMDKISCLHCDGAEVAGEFTSIGLLSGSIIAEGPVDCRVTGSRGDVWATKVTFQAGSYLEVEASHEVSRIQSGIGVNCPEYELNLVHTYRVIFSPLDKVDWPPPSN